MFSFSRSTKTSFENETHRKLATLLLDEFVQVISSFELNQIASLTYGAEVCDEIFEMLEEVLGKPLEYTVLAIHKSLVMAKHISIYGSEECVRSAIALGRLVEPLQVYNTVLLQQQRQGATALFYRIKGGGVDKGYSVREAAKELYDLVSNPEKLHQTRHSSADPNSLVPVGDDKAVFVTDEVRFYLLQKRMEEQQKILQHGKSNLAKADNGFGGGYNSKDGKAVVGAAHGIDEMLARERREKMKYRDDGTPASFNEGYQAPDEDDLLSGMPSSTNTHIIAATTMSIPTLDLLDLSLPPSQPTVTSATSVNTGSLLLGQQHHDLLGGGDEMLGSGSSTAATSTTKADYLRNGSGMDFLSISGNPTTIGMGGGSDLLGNGGVVDLLGVSTGFGDKPTDTATTMTTADLLNVPAPSSFVNHQSSIALDPLQHGLPLITSSSGYSSISGNPLSEPPSNKKPIMSSTGGSNVSSALDSLQVPSTKPAMMSVMAAEQRVWSLGSSSILDPRSTGPKGPLSELNGLPDVMANLALSSKQPTLCYHQHTATTGISIAGFPRWGNDSLSSDSESHGFGGVTMGGQITKTPSHGLTPTFGLAASDPFSGLKMASMQTSTSTSTFSSEIPDFCSQLVASPPQVVENAVPSLRTLPISAGGAGLLGGTIGTTPYGAVLSSVHDDNDNNAGFVMGGFIGSGLQPTAPPPPVPPPPPPAF